MHSKRGRPDIIIGTAVRDDNHNLSLVWFGFAEELLSGVRDGGAGARAAAPVVDALDGIEQLGFGVILAKGELQPLLVGVLHGADASVRVGDLELARDVGHELQHRAEVARADAAGAVDDERNVIGVEAGLAAHQLVRVAHPLHEGLHGLPKGEPACHRQREEAVGATHGLRRREDGVGFNTENKAMQRQLAKTTGATQMCVLNYTQHESVENI